MTLRARGWARTRRRILERDGYRCLAPVHHASCQGVANSVDHIVPRAKGGTHDDWNLRAAWSKCNSSMGGALNRKPDTMPAPRPSRW